LQKQENIMKLKFAVIYGSVRSQRQGIKAVRFIINQIESRGHEAVLIDPLDYPLPLVDKQFKDYPAGEAPEKMDQVAGILRDADAFIIVSGEYNHTMPPALTNLIDHFNKEFHWRTAGIVSYSSGSFGGVRATSHLRDFLSNVGLFILPYTMPIPKVQDAFDEQGQTIDMNYDRRGKRFLDEMEWYAKALLEARKNGVPHS
jgi:NAD(P)H-dependent FMN reductase